MTKQRLKFKGTLDELITILRDHDIRGDISERPWFHRFETQTGACLHWYTDGTIFFQGPAIARKELKEKLEGAFDGSGSEQQRAEGEIIPEANEMDHEDFEEEDDDPSELSFPEPVSECLVAIMGRHGFKRDMNAEDINTDNRVFVEEAGFTITVEYVFNEKCFSFSTGVFVCKDRFPTLREKVLLLGKMKGAAMVSEFFMPCCHIEMVAKISVENIEVRLIPFTENVMKDLETLAENSCELAVLLATKTVSDHSLDGLGI